ncbi:MAG: hypothetical protein L0216_13820 [Planctomycetales bacterium]|nr:hypothetical protein [Planctomycetales bacterium]
MKKRILSLLAFAVLASVGASGCSLWDWKHNWRHIKSFFRDMHELHVEIDRHFLNYDEDDPYNY